MIRRRHPQMEHLQPGWHAFWRLLVFTVRCLIWHGEVQHGEYVRMEGSTGPTYYRCLTCHRGVALW